MGAPVQTIRAIDTIDALDRGVVARGDRLLPVLPELTGILPDGGLVRGRTVSCTGDAAVSMALAACAGASRSGSWLALVGVPWIGIEAGRELGVALERTVAVEVDPQDVSQWAERVAATVDGFDLVITSVPTRAGAGILRRVGQRLTARGGVLIDIVAPTAPRPAAFAADLVLGAEANAGGGWMGVDQGSGSLRARRVVLTVSGRRIPRPVAVECRLPGPSGRLELVEQPSCSDVDLTVSA